MCCGFKLYYLYTSFLIHKDTIMNRYEKLELILNNISNLNPDLTRRIHESGAIEDWIVEHALEKVSLQYNYASHNDLET